MTAAPSVLLVGDFLANGKKKYGQVGPELAERLGRAGWSVRCTSGRESKIARIGDMVSSCWRLRKQYDLAQVDVFSGRAFLWAEAVCWTLRRAGKPYLLVLRGGNLPKFLEKQGERGAKLLRSARQVLAPSAYLKEELCWVRGDIELLPNPLEVSSYEFRPRRQIQPRLVWLRGFRYIYNPEDAVHTLARLHRRYADATLLMIGPDRNDGSMAKTREAVREHGLADAVEIVPGVPKNEVASWLQRGDIFLNTTGIDNTPISVLEALACGLLVISTNVGGLPYLLRDGEDALLVPEHDPEAMAQAAIRLIEDPEMAERLSRAARRKAEACDWSVVFPRWEQLLRRESGR